MRNITYLSLVFCACAIFSCKKGDIIGGKTSNQSLIVGKWLVYQQNTKVFDLSTNALVKDTILYFTSANLTQAWYGIYNTDGTAYVTTTPYKMAGASTFTIDTTAYLHYTILGSNLTIKPNGGGSETDPIIRLTSTDLGLETAHNGKPSTGWGLDVATTYLFIEDTYYTKQ